MGRPRRLAGFALCLAAAILSTSAASARTERFRWTHPDGAGVDSFKLYWGSASGSYYASLNVGKPPLDSTGAFYFDIVVPDTATIYAVVSAWDNGLESVLSNERVRTGITASPSPSPTPVACLAGQYTAQYFANETLSGTPVITRCESAPLNYNWGSGGVSGVGTEHFSARWVGMMSFEAAAYHFTTTADDGIRMFVDGQAVIDEWQPQGATTYTADVAMSAGTHEVRIEYFEATGVAVLKAEWAKLTSIPPPTGTTLGTPGQPYIVP